MGLNVAKNNLNRILKCNSEKKKRSNASRKIKGRFEGR